MNAAETKLPRLTFLHRPCRGYILRGEDGVHIVESPAFQTPFDFSSLILSVNYSPAGEDWLLSEVQVCQNGVWSKFFQLALYAEKISHSFDTQEDEAALVLIDVLKCKSPAQAYRFRLTVKGEAGLPSAAVCVAGASVYDEQAAQLPDGKREITVRPVSQMCLPVAEVERVRLCSPSSLSMALDTLGIPNDPLETAAAVYDDRARVYGNWTLNTAYACRLGLNAFVTRFDSLGQLEKFLTPDSLILASIAYKTGELTGAAVSHTPGHFVLLCGWEQGKVRVADPAAETPQQVIRLYDAKQFARAWLYNKCGVGYLVRKV